MKNLSYLIALVALCCLAGLTGCASSTPSPTPDAAAATPAPNPATDAEMQKRTQRTGPPQ